LAFPLDEQGDGRRARGRRERGVLERVQGKNADLALLFVAFWPRERPAVERCSTLREEGSKADSHELGCLAETELRAAIDVGDTPIGEHVRTERHEFRGEGDREPE
jgi:hypothetical protein